MAQSNLSPFKEFRVELSPPSNPINYHAYYNELDGLMQQVSKFSLISRALGSVSGFERQYNFACFLKDKKPDIDLLCNLTCHDLNKTNIGSKLTKLKDLKIRRILLLSGQDYKQPAGDLYFKNSYELAKYVDEHFHNWFETVAVAGYAKRINGRPCIATNEEPVAEVGIVNLEKKLAIRSVNSLYLQCTLVASDLACLKSLPSGVEEVVASIPVFTDGPSLEQVFKRTGIDRRFCLEDSPVNLIRKLVAEIRRSTCIKSFSMCPFGQYKFTNILIENMKQWEILVECI